MTYRKTAGVDISSIAYANIERIWWDYDSSAPGHPPKWRDFEVWADDTLFVNDPQEPQDGDTVRIWYTTDHTLNGLDAATETTFPDRHASVLALGASAFAASSRRVTILEELGANTWAPRNLREWAEAQLQRFYAQLEKLGKRRASLDSGIAPMPNIDRFDTGETW